MSFVYVKQTEKPEGIIDLLDQIDVELGGKPVFIKPNVVVPASKESGIVTDPHVVKAIIDFFREKGATEFIVGESPGIGQDVQKCFECAGYKFLEKEEGVRLVSLNDGERIEVQWKYGTIRIPEIALKSFYVNVAKLKTHMNTTVTLTMKNQKGLIMDESKKHFHKLGLDEPIAQLAKVVKPDLAIIDGIIGIDGDGPLYSGNKIQSNLLVAGKDILGVDATGARLMEINPLEVEHIRIARELGLGDIDPEILGDAIKKVSIKFTRANEEYFQFQKLYNKRNRYACSMCSNSLYEAIMAVKGNPAYWFKYGPKLAYLIFLKGVNFVSGGNSQLPNKPGKTICFGECTKNFAKENGLDWVPGCPPNPKDILRKL